MRVAEIFNSIEGESFNAGKLTTFVRTAGCNLRCNYCDTKWATIGSAGMLMTTDAIIQEIVNATNVTLTGGEPLMQADIKDLLKKITLKTKIQIVNVETNGSLPIKGYSELLLRTQGRLRFSMDYKFGQKFELDNLRYLSRIDALKFVIEDKDDLDEFIEVWKTVSEKKSACPQVYLSPCFEKTTPVKIVDWLKDFSSSLFGSQKIMFESQVRVQLQMHKYIWNPEKRGV